MMTLLWSLVSHFVVIVIVVIVVVEVVVYAMGVVLGDIDEIYFIFAS